MKRRLNLEPLEPRNLLATFTVNSLGDLGDKDLNDGRAEDENGNTTLRAVIEHINHIGGEHVIRFGVDGAIPLSNGLPAINGTVEVDGRSPGGRIELTDNLPTGSPGLTLKGPRSFVHDIVVNTFVSFEAGADESKITSSYVGVNKEGTAAIGSGIFVRSSKTEVGLGTEASRNVTTHISVSGSDNKVRGNYVGISTDGLQALTNIATYSDGIFVSDGANNVIGGATAPERNVVGGFKQLSGDGSAAGIRIIGFGFGGNPRNTQVIGNYIGTDKSGTRAIGNAVGIKVSKANAAEGQQIVGNLVSGNSSEGIFIVSSESAISRNVQIKGNLIGLQPDGLTALGNGRTGVTISASTQITVGGTAAADRNVISANRENGIEFLCTSALLGQPCSLFPTNNIILGNYIGTDKTGLVDVGNLKSGIFVAGGATDNKIGGPAKGEGNLISGNGLVGVYIFESSNNRVQGNVIGLTAPVGEDEKRTPLPNDSTGVYIQNPSTGNSIGGPNKDEGNTIAFNGSGGVFLTASAKQNPILGNRIFSNGGLGIDLNANGVTPNDVGNPQTCPGTASSCPDTDTGANNLQNAPVVEATAGEFIRVKLDSVPNATFRIEVFFSEQLDPSGSGEGQFFVKGFDATTNDKGQIEQIADIEAEPGDLFITATATRIENGKHTDTSEFSGYSFLTVNSTADLPDNNPGDGRVQIGDPSNSRKVTVNGQQVDMVTLRAAIMEANALKGLQLISFNIPQSDPGFANGIYTIQPKVNDSSVNQEDVTATNVQYRVTETTVIDATTQPGFDAQNGKPVIRLLGNEPSAGADGFELAGDDITIRGFTINRFKQDGFDIASGRSNNIEGNYIGVHFTGDSVTSEDGTPMGNGGFGIRVRGETSSSDLGSNLPNLGNVISGNRAGGISIGDSATSYSTSMYGNRIGTDRTGEVGLGNDGPGVLVLNSEFATIGGGFVGGRNVISANKGDGILVAGGARSVDVHGNHIGTSLSGNKPLGNEGHGVRIGDQTLGAASRVWIGGVLPTDGNIISANLQTGIFVRGSNTHSTTILGNLIGTNASGDSNGPDAKLGNQGGGIRIEDATDTTIGEKNSKPNVISGNRSDGIVILDTTPGDSANVNVTVQNNIVGLTKDGQIGLGNVGSGIVIRSASGIVIGGEQPGHRNIISANTDSGIRIDGGSARNLVAGNYIGTDLEGETTANPANPQNGLGNNVGVRIDVSSENVIGYVAAGVLDPNKVGAGNVISGNQLGVLITSFSSKDNRVTGNLIGTDATGLLPLGNKNGGIELSSSNTAIGGTTVAERNVIADNQVSNIRISFESSDGPLVTQSNRIVGNFIGTDKTGQKLLGTAKYGVELLNSRGNSIGGSTMDLDRNASANVLGGHTTAGIYVRPLLDNQPSNNVIEGNYIGVAPNLTPLPNRGEGIQLGNRGNRVGGDSANQGNIIASNEKNGILIKFEHGFGAEDNTLLGNSIYDNGLLGINLAGGAENSDGVTENDALDADGESLSANRLQNKPELQSAVRDSETGRVTIAGVLQSVPSTSYRIEYFASDRGDASGFGEGQRFIGTETVTTSSTGEAELDFESTTTVRAQDYITATATRIVTDQLRDTSEFSNGIHLGTLTIRGTKFQDTDGNGKRDSGEPGLRDWLITLYDDQTGAKVEEKRSRSDGSYFFEVTPGRYRLEEESRSDWISTTPTIPSFEVTTGPVVGKDFGSFKYMTVTGLKFDDLNLNGSQEDNEPLLTGPFTIQLDLPGDHNDEEKSLTGSANFQFTNVGPGDKSVTNRTFRLTEKITAPGFSPTFPIGQIETPITSGLETSVKFGNMRNMTVRVEKFHDLDGDGVQLVGLEDEMLAGFEMQLDLNSDGDDDDSATTLTDAAGKVTFSNVGIGDPGGAKTIMVREVVPNGWRQTTPTRSQAMASGAVLTEKIGNFREGAIYGLKYEDIDADRQFNNADKPIAGVTIILEVDQNRDGTPETGLQRQVTTDDQGEYAFTDLGPGRYTIREVSPSDAIPTTQPVTIDLLGGEVHAAESGQGVIGVAQRRVVTPALAFGNFYFGAIHGYKFNDLDGQGRDNGDPRISGVQFILDVDANEDGTFETFLTSTTDSQGHYGFRNLGPGKYRVREVVPDGQQQTTPAPATIDLRSGEVWVAQGGMATVTEHQVQVLQLDLAFGNFKLVDISGSKFLDTDEDGVRDASEPGLANWKIELDLDSNGTIDRTATTNATGQFTFARVGPGRHTLNEVQQPSYEQTAPAGGKHVVTTESGKNVTNFDFGNRTLKSVIAGTIFEDANQNGTREDAEPGVADAVVYLDANNDGILNHETASQANKCDEHSLEPCWITRDDGGYAFAVSIGSYAIRQVPSAGATQTSPANPDFYTVQVTADNQKFLGRDFGNGAPAGAIFGYVFNDLNGDYFDDQEPRLIGWPVTLEMETSPDNFVQVAQTVSDSNGQFVFRNLGPGEYDVLLNDPSAETRFGFLVSLEEGDVYMAFPDQAPTGPDQIAIVDEDLARGVFYHGTVRGYVYDDVNANGQNNQEPRLADVDVRLEVDFDGDEVADFEQTATTNSQGVYEFTELVSYESYRVVPVLDSNQRHTTGPIAWTLIDSGQLWVADQNLATPRQSYQQASVESRLALGRFTSTWTNPIHRSDVSGDGFIAPLDALAVINSINEDGARPLTARANPFAAPYLDVNADGFLAPQDALVVINYINTNGSGPVPEGEAADGANGIGEGEGNDEAGGKRELTQSVIFVLPSPDRSKQTLRRRSRSVLRDWQRLPADDDWEAILDTIAVEIDRARKLT